MLTGSERKVLKVAAKVSKQTAKEEVSFKSIMDITGMSHPEVMAYCRALEENKYCILWEGIPNHQLVGIHLLKRSTHKIENIDFLIREYLYKNLLSMLSIIISIIALTVAILTYILK